MFPGNRKSVCYSLSLPDVRVAGGKERNLPWLLSTLLLAQVRSLHWIQIRRAVSTASSWYPSVSASPALGLQRSDSRPGLLCFVFMSAEETNSGIHGCYKHWSKEGLSPQTLVWPLNAGFMDLSKTSIQKTTGKEAIYPGLFMIPCYNTISLDTSAR